MIVPVQLMLRFAIAAAVALGFAGAASACDAPPISEQRYAAMVGALGQASYQIDPSTAILKAVYTAPDQPPSVDTIYAGGDVRFLDALIAEVKLLRTVCATEATPVTWTYMRRMGVIYTRAGRYREAEPRLKYELEIAQVVRLIKDVKFERVRFDFNEMGCPFYLRFSPMRPYLPNRVEEVGQKDPLRQPFLAWLRQATLDIPKDMMVTAIARESSVSVPCVVLDLS